QLVSLVLQNVRLTESEEDGTYEFLGVAPGEYTLSSMKAGFMAFSFGQRSESERGETFTLAKGDVRDRVDMTLPKYGAVEGRIVDEYGDPVEAARIRVLQLRFVGGRRRLVDIGGGGPGAAQLGLTDDLGRYRFSGLPPGQYFIGAVVGQLT